MGIDGNAILNHGIKREVYAIPLATNWQKILLGQHSKVQSCVVSAAEISIFCLQRWIVPRANWDNRYKNFERSRVMDSLLDGVSEPSWK